MKPYTVVVPKLDPADLWGLIELLGKEFPNVVYDAALSRDHTDTLKNRAETLRLLQPAHVAIEAAKIDAPVVVLACTDEAGVCAQVVAHPLDGIGFRFTPRVAGPSRRPLLDRVAKGLGGRVEIGENSD